MYNVLLVSGDTTLTQILSKYMKYKLIIMNYISNKINNTELNVQLFLDRVSHHRTNFHKLLGQIFTQCEMIFAYTVMSVLGIEDMLLPHDHQVIWDKQQWHNASLMC